MLSLVPAVPLFACSRNTSDTLAWAIRTAFNRTATEVTIIDELLKLISYGRLADVEDIANAPEHATHADHHFNSSDQHL